MPLEEIVSPTPEAPDAQVESRPVAVEVRDLSKTFQIPLQRVDSIKERVLHPFASTQSRHLTALRGVSFDVHEGEFFGIVGRNGTGKSTLLKILASIYAADAGTIRMAGRVAPFIELGVGFNVDLTARENVVLNGVMMGLSRQQAEDRVQAVIEFAELEEFAGLKLKNYSSGMLVRLAFSVMIQSDADILLIDEVLAVGDAAFQQKCRDVFHEMRGDRTLILVTHDMSAVEQFCHRAMLLDRGDIQAIGDPDEIAHRYLRLNFAENTGAEHEAHPVAPEGSELLLLDAWLECDGERTDNVEQGRELTFHATFEAPTEIPGPSFGFVIANEDKVEVGGFHVGMEHAGAGHADLLAAGERLHIKAKISNRFTPGRYAMQAWAFRNHTLAEPLITLPRVLDFVVFGTEATVGLVSIVDEIELSSETQAEAAERPEVSP
jgi:ABC-type polysaccharide/polyol phosphate transport system ATPase subunit